MELIRGFHNVRAAQRGCVLTIGNFDGVHLGHQALLRRAHELADAQQLPVTVLTFKPTPREYFNPGEQAGRLSTFRGKFFDLCRFGADRVLVQRFSAAFAALTAEQFVEALLGARLGVRAVVVGDDFRFGAGRAGDLELLRRYAARLGFHAEGLTTITVAGRRCSSSALREALSQPDLALAQQLLGRPYGMRGRLRPGLQLGRKLGMPTTNIFLHGRPALRLGVYAVLARAEGREWQGVANIGVRPTLGLTRCLLETHLFGNPGEMYGKVMEVEFHHFLRDEQHFDTLDALAARMFEDRREALSFFGRKPA